MSDISLYQHEKIVEELQSMPSETVTDVEDIPDQTPVADLGDADDLDS